MKILRDELNQLFGKMCRALLFAVENKQNVLAKINGEQYVVPYGNPTDMLEQAKEFLKFCDIAKDAKTILFSAEQAEVFVDISRSHRDSLDFRLPFEHVFLQFSKPLRVPYTKRADNDFDRGSVVAMAIGQIQKDKHQVEADIKRRSVEQREGIFGTVLEYKHISLPDSEEVFINTVSIVYEDLGTETARWATGAETIFADDPLRSDMITLWRNVAVACIGYINCENVYLESVGGAPGSVNRKREAKGKRRLEPYYVCRIRGVSYDKSDTSGTGSKHGIRYDVRGHFRRLEGKTIWVRAHQRGLANELYIPKVYKVDRITPPPAGSSTPD